MAPASQCFTATNNSNHLTLNWSNQSLKAQVIVWCNLRQMQVYMLYNFSLQAYLEMFHLWQQKSPGWCPSQQNELWQSVMFWKICTTFEYVQQDKVAFTVQNKPSTCTNTVCLHCLPWSAVVPHGANKEHAGKPDNLCYATVEAKANLTLPFISPTSNCWVLWMLTSKANTVNNC